MQTKIKYKGAIYVAADHERCQNGTHWNEHQSDDDYPRSADEILHGN